jgi:hypothetical protein
MGLCVHNNRLSGNTKHGEYINQLSDYKQIKRTLFLQVNLIRQWTMSKDNKTLTAAHHYHKSLELYVIKSDNSSPAATSGLAIRNSNRASFIWYVMWQRPYKHRWRQMKCVSNHGKWITNAMGMTWKRLIRNSQGTASHEHEQGTCGRWEKEGRELNTTT